MDFNVWNDYEGYVIHPGLYGYQIETSGSHDSMEVSVRDGNIIIVTERNDQIVAYYNLDGFETDTLNEVVINSDGERPRIMHTGDLKATCSFILDEEILYTSTQDGGKTWSTPEKLAVEEDIIAADMSIQGYAYTDGEITYFDPIGGEEPEANIEWSITATGGIFNLINKEATDSISIPAGSSESIKLGMILGFGEIVIKVTAGATTKTVAGNQRIIFTSI
jgi:hypothetical protein